jgi:hypothetical protein
MRPLVLFVIIQVKNPGARGDQCSFATFNCFLEVVTFLEFRRDFRILIDLLLILVSDKL